MAVVGCDNDSTDDNGGGGNEPWRASKYKYYTVTDGVASLSMELVINNYIIYNYTSNTNYEQKYTYTTTSYYGGTTTTSSLTTHVTRNGQTVVQVDENSKGTSSFTTTYDSATGLQLEISSIDTNNSGGTTTLSRSFDIVLLSDAGGIKTYKASYKTYTINGTSLDLSSSGYEEYKIKDGKILESKSYTADGVRSGTTFYIYPDNCSIT